MERKLQKIEDIHFLTCQTLKNSAILFNKIGIQERSSVMISSSQKQGLVMIAVVVGLMTLPILY
ncbi:hypothetical protein VSAK1_12375 [Vibrio mediterranei AK1]|nr:hypothetical protein VSAK1_12375 [Vibrio mediterranei AK1]